MDEPYHSVHGAVQESQHVFIKAGFSRIEKPIVNILEMGFGTGLNALLTLNAAISSGKRVHYHSVEKYPLEEDEFSLLNFEKEIHGCPEKSLDMFHRAAWGEPGEPIPGFILFKEKSDFREFTPRGTYDLVYYDAFAPKKQPHLWTGDIFRRVAGALRPGAVLVTYTAMGSVRRTLKSCGFEVEKIPGPPGKREMIRAVFA